MRKIFKIQNQRNDGMGNGTTSIVGVEIQEENFFLEKIKGIDITLDGFLKLLEMEKLEEVIEEISDRYLRKCMYRIGYYEGPSGCRDYYISYLQERERFYTERRKELLHLSMYTKINKVDIFVPDLVELLPKLYILSNRSTIENIYITEIEEVCTSSYKDPIEEIMKNEVSYAYENFDSFLKDPPPFLESEEIETIKKTFYLNMEGKVLKNKTDLMIIEYAPATAEKYEAMKEYLMNIHKYVPYQEGKNYFYYQYSHEYIGEDVGFVLIRRP